MNNPMKYKLEKGTLTITSCDPKPTGDLIIPDAIDGFPVTSIGYGAFWGCSGLTSVKIGNIVTSIGTYAFQWCSGLTSVTLPSSITSIGSYAFYGCNGLTSVTLPSSLTSMSDYAFPNHTVVTKSECKNWVNEIVK